MDDHESHVVPSLTQEPAVKAAEEMQRHSWILLECTPWATSSCAGLNAALEARADDKGWCAVTHWDGRQVQLKPVRYGGGVRKNFAVEVRDQEGNSMRLFGATSRGACRGVQLQAVISASTIMLGEPQEVVKEGPAPGDSKKKARSEQGSDESPASRHRPKETSGSGRGGGSLVAAPSQRVHSRGRGRGRGHGRGRGRGRARESSGPSTRRSRGRGRGRGRARESSSPSTRRSSDLSCAPALHERGRSRSPASNSQGFAATNSMGASSPLGGAVGPATAAAEVVGHPDRRKQDDIGLEACQLAKRRRLDPGGQSGRAGSVPGPAVPSSEAPGSSEGLAGQSSGAVAEAVILRPSRVLCAKGTLPPAHGKQLQLQALALKPDMSLREGRAAIGGQGWAAAAAGQQPQGKQPRAVKERQMLPAAGQQSPVDTQKGRETTVNGIRRHLCVHLRQGDFWYRSWEGSLAGKQSKLREKGVEGELRCCHQCVEACLDRRCTACSKTLCARCADENLGLLLQHPNACPQEALALFQQGTCTCCLGLCRSKRCLMKPADSQHLKRLGGRPAFDVRQTLVYHAHRLLALFAHFQLLQQQKALEFQREGEPCKCYEQVPRTATEPGARELCDNCGKATPDLRRSCDNPACPLGGGDICLDCLNGESRWSGKPAGELQCLHGACTGRLQLGRRFDDSMLTALKDYPTLVAIFRRQAAASNIWRWFPTRDNAQALVNAPVYHAPTPLPNDEGSQVQAVDKDDSDGRAIQQHGRPVRQPAKAADEAAAGAGSSGSGVASAQSSLTQACGKLCSCACAARGTAGAAAGLQEGVGAERSWSGAAVPLLGSISEGLQPQVTPFALIADPLKRHAAERAEGDSNHILTLSERDLAVDSDVRGTYAMLFQERFCVRGEPVIVRQVPKLFFSDSATLTRISKLIKSVGKHHPLKVMCMSPDANGKGREMEMSAEEFFEHFEANGMPGEEKGGPRIMLKLKDFPPDGSFSQHLGRHAQAFSTAVPMPEYTHPEGPLNMASAIDGLKTVTVTRQDGSRGMVYHYNKPDLGPKSYIATGSSDNQTSVTKLHKDLSDAVNVCVRVVKADDTSVVVRCGDARADHSPGSRYGGAGAVWDIFRREDAARLSVWLRSNARLFMHEGCCLQQLLGGDELKNPLHSHRFMLDEGHLKQLKLDTQIEPQHLEQYEAEAVFIPAGCPHQVRNLRSCVKVAVDFLAPTSIPQAAQFAAEVRGICKVQPKMGLLEVPSSAAAERAAAAFHGDDQVVQDVPDMGYINPSQREGADKLQYELSLYLAIQQSVEHLRAAEAEAAEAAAAAPAVGGPRGRAWRLRTAEAEAAEAAAPAAAAVGKPRGRAQRKAGAALAPKAAAGAESSAGPSAARQHGQAEPSQAQSYIDNSNDKAAWQSEHALVAAEAAEGRREHAQAAAEDKGLVAGGGAAQEQAADAATQAAGAAAEPAEAAAQVPAKAVAQVPAAGRRRGRPRKGPATAVHAQPMVLCQEAADHSQLGKRAAEVWEPDSRPGVKQTRRKRPVVKPEDGGASAGSLGGAEGCTPFSAVATAEGVDAAVLPAAEPAAVVQCNQGQKRRIPAVGPGHEGAERRKQGASAELLVGAEGLSTLGAAVAAEGAAAERTCQASAAAAADKAGTGALHAADCAAAGGGGRGTSKGESVGPGHIVAAADVRQSSRGPATQAAADPAAIATLGLVQATAAGMPGAGAQGAVPAGLWAAGGCGPPIPTCEAVAAEPTAAVKADDVGMPGGPATAALGTAVPGGSSLGPCSERPCVGRSPLAAVAPRSDCPKPSPESRLARTAGWGSLFSSRWAS